MELQLTALVTLVGVIVMLAAWIFTGRRMRQSQAVIFRPVQLLRSFFLYMAIFFAIMWAPHLWLSLDPSKFPLYMAIGYTFGHIFLYLAFIAIARMMFLMLPRLAPKEPLIIVVGSVLIVLITIVNAATMIFGRQPSYDYAQHLTQFNASPVVGAFIGLFAALTVLPPAVLFIINAFRSHGPRRVRSFLLGIGFFVLMTAGPLHDIAWNWQAYMVADVFSILSIILVGAGVVYRPEEELSLAKQPTPAAPAASL